MSAAFLAPLTPVAEAVSVATSYMSPAGLNAGVSSPSFGEFITQGLGQLNQQMLASQTDLQNLALGNVQNLHQLMISLEESRLNFQLMLQVRNRLLESYQDLMRMQV
jgi:flagellar hook-basal body complex protein FliE